MIPSSDALVLAWNDRWDREGVGWNLTGTPKDSTDRSNFPCSLHCRSHLGATNRVSHSHMLHVWYMYPHLGDF